MVYILLLYETPAAVKNCPKFEFSIVPTTHALIPSWCSNYILSKLFLYYRAAFISSIQALPRDSKIHILNSMSSRIVIREKQTHRGVKNLMAFLR